MFVIVTSLFVAEQKGSTRVRHPAFNPVPVFNAAVSRPLRQSTRPLVSNTLFQRQPPGQTPSCSHTVACYLVPCRHNRPRRLHLYYTYQPNDNFGGCWCDKISPYSVYHHQESLVSQFRHQLTMPPTWTFHDISALTRGRQQIGTAADTWIDLEHYWEL